MGSRASCAVRRVSGSFNPESRGRVCPTRHASDAAPLDEAAVGEEHVPGAPLAARGPGPSHHEEDARSHDRDADAATPVAAPPNDATTAEEKDSPRPAPKEGGGNDAGAHTPHGLARSAGPHQGSGAAAEGAVVNTGAGGREQRGGGASDTLVPRRGQPGMPDEHSDRGRRMQQRGGFDDASPPTNTGPRRSEATSREARRGQSEERSQRDIHQHRQQAAEAPHGGRAAGRRLLSYDGSGSVFSPVQSSSPRSEASARRRVACSIQALAHRARAVVMESNEANSRSSSRPTSTRSSEWVKRKSRKGDSSQRQQRDRYNDGNHASLTLLDVYRKYSRCEGDDVPRGGVAEKEEIRGQATPHGKPVPSNRHGSSRRGRSSNTAIVSDDDAPSAGPLRQEKARKNSATVWSFGRTFGSPNLIATCGEGDSEDDDDDDDECGVNSFRPFPWHAPLCADSAYGLGTAPQEASVDDFSLISPIFASSPLRSEPTGASGRPDAGAEGKTGTRGPPPATAASSTSPRRTEGDRRATRSPDFSLPFFTPRHPQPEPLTYPRTPSHGHRPSPPPPPLQPEWPSCLESSCLPSAAAQETSGLARADAATATAPARSPSPTAATTKTTSSVPQAFAPDDGVTSVFRPLSCFPDRYIEMLQQQRMNVLDDAGGDNSGNAD
ncbi:uncharacterized protein Tco025E_01766 [Trypanosoma conorhini]|uniref:Uncharacterized protein n=1 Tax=Trypanosoma conorhini TaxID=83891 RepID=A0A422Q7W6_9TRYP|nr:uncharacterized protein Tco025E_01766 [Trypanosoma conorhini]RNF26017.1 hypothetical protein Tco025E_01766 [Trypanosoma conorhini]